MRDLVKGDHLELEPSVPVPQREQLCQAGREADPADPVPIQFDKDRDIVHPVLPGGIEREAAPQQLAELVLDCRVLAGCLYEVGGHELRVAHHHWHSQAILPQLGLGQPLLVWF
jgi:hypothetical protein